MPRGGRSRRDERGAVLIMVSMLASTIMVVAAFAVDLGMQRVLRRDMQALADVVALDMAWELDGAKTVTTLALTMPDSDWNKALARSIARNSPSIGQTPVVTTEVGYLDEHGDFVAMTGAGDTPTAVRVHAASKVEFSLRPGAGGSGAGRWAVAANRKSACFKAGSFAVRLASKDSALLNDLLGDGLGTTVLGYDGLADARVSLLAVTAALRAGSPNGVLDLAQVRLGDFVAAMATALNGDGAHSADVALLETIRTQLDAGLVIDLGKLLSVGTGNPGAVDATVNVLDLVYGAAIVANGDQFVGVPNLTVSLPNVTSITSQLTIIEPPKLACNDGEAKTSQVALTIRGQVQADLVGASVTGPVVVTVNLANATATLNDVHCTNDAADSISLNVSNQNLASATTDFSGVSVKPLLLPSVSLLGLKAGTVQPDPSGMHTLAVPTYYYPNPYTTAQGSQTMPLLQASDLSALGISLDQTIVTPLLDSVLNPIVTAVNGLITDSASPLLGLNVAGVDLFALPTPSCSKPVLRG